MNIYFILSRLLDYPDRELYENLNLTADALAASKSLDQDEKEAASKLISWMKSMELTRLQGVYVDTFDMVPEHDLHLTHHLFGDDRGRGPALIDLAEYYRAHGLQHVENEIPDYLPLILEYVSTLDENGAQVFLGDARKVTSVLEDNLKKSGSPYACLFTIINNRGSLLKTAA